MTLTDFLLARIAEEEWAARLGQHDPEPNSHGSWDGRRVIAECEAKRQIVEALVDAAEAVAKYNPERPQPPSYWQEWGNYHALRFAVEVHASTHADHPDYREEWRP